ncbi:2-C-methyl-D-erythritol 4-phosphate cytidylyltransferase [Paenibacillus sp. MCAF20]
MLADWGVVIVAAGRGTRMGTKESKQYLQLADKPILVHTLELFERMDTVKETVLVVGADDVPRCQEWVARYGFAKVKAVLAGGKERQHSVHIGLQAITAEWVMVHDGDDK